jgi:hypothetical protein
MRKCAFFNAKVPQYFIFILDSAPIYSVLPKLAFLFSANCTFFKTMVSPICHIADLWQLEVKTQGHVQDYGGSRFLELDFQFPATEFGLAKEFLDVFIYFHLFLGRNEF